MSENRLPPLVSCHHPINDNLVLGSRLGVTETPTIIAEDGRMLPGAVSAAQLKPGSMSLRKSPWEMLARSPDLLQPDHRATQPLRETHDEFAIFQ